MLPSRLQTTCVVARDEGRADPGIDAEMEVSSGEKCWRCVAEVKSRGTPKLVAAAANQVRQLAQETGLAPLVVFPYLAEKQLQMLAEQGVSGIDLCGNGVVQVPGEMFVFRTGYPNQYPASTPIRNVYQGSSSLAPRVFLLKPRFESVGEVAKEIERRDGQISLGTVSKVLKALDEDLIVRKDGRTTRLLQAEALLDKLAANFQRPRSAAPQAFQWEVPENKRPTIAKVAKESQIDLVATGTASVNQYAVMPREAAPIFPLPSLLTQAVLPHGRVWAA